ncbi:MAG: thioredoxin family protein [Hyphomicrobiales bacterium]|nr:thioredoxin family protein [Hyphomicrobiales bacterium]
MRGIWLKTLCFIVLCASSSLAGAQGWVAVGMEAPIFTLPTSNGETFSLAEHRGKIVVLEWYNKDCPYVRKHYETGNMQALQKEYTDLGVVWLSIISSAPGKQGYMTPEEALENQREVKSFATAVGLDPEGGIGRMFKAKTTPHIYIIDADGILAYQGAIDDTPTADKADVKHAQNYVAAALDAMLDGEEVVLPVIPPYGCSIKYADE